MKRLLSSLIGCSIETVEGSQGVVRDFYFDDHSWLLRYLVCHLPRTASSASRSVLVSADHFLPPQWALPIFPVRLSDEQLLQCPDWETDVPVSKQKAEQMAVTILSPENGGIGTAGILMTPIPRYVNRLGRKAADPRLRSFQAVRHYALRTSNQEVGRMRDLAIDEADWAIHGIVVRLRRRFGGRTIIVPPQWVSEIDWFNGALRSEADADHWKDAPDFPAKRHLLRQK